MKTQFLCHRNNWESHEYTIGEKAVTDIKKVKLYSKGSKTGKIYKVGSFQDYRTYNDMGHDYSATSKQYYIDVPFHGASIRATLDDLIEQGVKIEILE